MFQYRHALVRLRAGDTVREIARSGLMGRDRLGALRALAEQQSWLTPDAELPDDATLAAALGTPKRAASTISSVEPLREVVQHWFNAGVQGRAIHTPRYGASTATRAATLRWCACCSGCAPLGRRRSRCA